MNCPRCGNGRVLSNKLKFPSLMHGPAGIRLSGHPAFVTSCLLGEAITQVINVFRHSWRCDHCDHRFS